MFFMLCFVCSLARELLSFVDVTPRTVTTWIVLLEALLGLFLVPAWFVMLGIGLGNCQSISALNSQFADAVAEAALNIEDVVADQRLAQMAEDQAANRAAKEAKAPSKASKFSNPLMADMAMVSADSDQEDGSADDE
jgi:hypothetical protein